MPHSIERIRPSAAPPSGPMPAETKALIHNLAEEGNGVERRTWELERLWELGNAVGLMRGETAEIKGEMLSVEGQIVRLDLRIIKIEGKQEKSAEDTGQHDIADLHRQLVERDAAIAERKERSRHWVRWVAAMIGTLVVGLLVGYVVHWMTRGSR